MEQERGISVQEMPPARRIMSRLERTNVKLNVSNAGNVGKNELDSHTDTICARGMPSSAIRTQAESLQLMRYAIKDAYGVSEDEYQGTIF
jgi:hypothetical protein